jgi:hypothetical protein
MAGPRRVHDRVLLDALEAIEPETFSGDVWRITRRGRDPLRGSTAHGRWSPSGEFEVLYTSLARDGALAEIGYRLSLEPIWPSRIQHDIAMIAVETERSLRIADIPSLSPLGVDITKYEGFDYTATQAIAAAAHFLEFDGMLVPSARAPRQNLVIFMDRLTAGARLEIQSSEAVDWATWRSGRARSK